MKRGSHPLLYTLLAIGILAAVMTGSPGWGLLSDPWKLWNRLVWPLLRLTFFISVGLFVALAVEGAGWTDRLAVMARPFMRWGHLSSEMGSAFTAAFFSGTTSLAMLATFLQEGTMTRREVTLAVLLDTFPSYFLHLPTTFFIILPLVGRAGVLYLLVTFAAALLRFAAVLLYTHFSFPRPAEGQREGRSKSGEGKPFLRLASDKLRSRLTRVLLIVVPVYVIMLLLSERGFFHWLREALAFGISSSLFPVEGVSVVILSLVAELTSGYAAAGAMLESGTLTVAQTVLALLAGQLLGTPLRALRHQLPYYMGVFHPSTGLYLMVVGQTFRLLSLVLAGGVFLLVMRAVGQV